MLYVFSSHCYCHPVIYSLSLFIIYSVNSFIANVICYITIPSLNEVLYLVSCILIFTHLNYTHTHNQIAQITYKTYKTHNKSDHLSSSKYTAGLMDGTTVSATIIPIYYRSSSTYSVRTLQQYTITLIPVLSCNQCRTITVYPYSYL